MKTNVTSFDQLPITLRAEQVAAVLGISRSNAYALMRQEDFPTLHIGKGRRISQLCTSGSVCSFRRIG